MKTRYKETIAVGAIIVAGLLVRLYRINQPLLEFFPQRQTQTAEITRNIFVNGWDDFWTPKVRYLADDGTPLPYVLEFPFYNGLVAVFYHLFGPNVIWGRATSLIFFVLSTILLYRLVAKTVSTSVAILSMLFFVFSPLHVLVSRSFQPEELALFLLLFAIYKKSWIVFSLATLTKLPLVLFAPMMFFVSSRAKSRDPVGKVSDIHIVSLDSSTPPTKVSVAWNDILKGTLSLLPAILWYLRASRLTVHPAIARNFDLTNWFQPALWLNPKWYFSLFQIEHIWVLTTLGLLFFWLGLTLMVQKRTVLSVRKGLSLIDANLWLVWLLSGLSYLAIFNYHAMTHEYYHLLLLPPVSFFIGLGLHDFIINLPKTRSRRLRTAIAGLCLLLFVTGQLFPAMRKIQSAPTHLDRQDEVTVDRYNKITEWTR